MKRRHLGLVVAVLAVGLLALLLLSACGDEETTTTEATTATTEATPTTAAPTETTAGETETTAAELPKGDPITIGLLSSVTGVEALGASEERWAKEKAAADYNAKGGIKLADGQMHEIVLKLVDDGSTDSGAAAGMERLIKTEGLKLILGTTTTPFNQAAATVAEQYGAFYQTNTCWIDDSKGEPGPNFMGGMNLEWTADVFEYAAESGFAAVNAAQNMAEPPAKFAVMTENTPDGVGFGDSTAALLEQSGFEVVSYEKYNSGQKDFSSIILKFKDAGVEGVVTLISPADGITFVRQLKEQNWAPKFMFGYKGFWPVDFMDALGPDSDYVCFDGFWSEDLPFPGAKELGEAFAAEHDGDTSVSIGLSYATATILFQAIEAAGSTDPAAVRDQVFGQTFEDTVIGDIVYGGAIPGDEGIAHIPFLSFQWMGGERVIVGPPEFVTGETQTFAPWDAR